MKKTRSFLCVILTVIMLFELSSVSFGFQGDKALWDLAWEREPEKIETAVTMFVGSDENDRTIAWYSDADEGYVELKTINGTEKINANVKKTPEGDYRLWVILTDLSAGLYAYKCVSGDFESETYTFTIEENENSTVLYVTDIHITEDADGNMLRDTSYLWNQVLNSAVKTAGVEGNTIDAVVSGGDQATEGLRNEYEGLSAPRFMKSLPFAVSVGNHDRKSVGYKYYTANPNEADQTFKSYIANDYWFRQGDALFLMLDSCNVSMKEHYKFMKEATEQNEDAVWIIAVMHHDLFGGRKPSRDSENEMLQLLWTPFFDEFGVDLCLYGHSHYYSVSNVIYGRDTVEKTGHNAQLSDPQGTVYVASGSATRPSSVVDDEGNTPPVGEHIGYTRLEENETIYNLIEITDDTLILKSYSSEDNEEFNRLTISKESKQGGHNYKNSARFIKRIAFFVGRIVNIVNNADMYDRYKEQGFDVTLWEGLIGS